MIRYIVLLLNMIGFFIYQLFFAGDVSVSQAVPISMSPGNDYTIALTISKGSIGGFAKLQQELPQGCTATPIDSKGAAFSMSGTSVKLIWTSLPTDAQFSVSYKISVSSSAAPGSNVLGGKFYYVEDNVKKAVDIPESDFNIDEGSAAVANPDSTLGKANLVVTNTSSTGKGKDTDSNSLVVVSPDNTTSGAGVSESSNCSRKITGNGPSDYTVEVSIHRGQISGFAKLQENIPAGFSASSLQSSGASFSFTDQKVKMVWIDLPTDDLIKVSYKLSGSAENAKIDGVFSFIDNDETKKITIPATLISGNNTETVNATPQNSTKTANVIPQQKTENVSAATATPMETKSSDHEQTKTENPTFPVRSSDQNASEAQAPKNDLTNQKIPSAQHSVDYKVQVCALRQTPVNTSYFLIRYGLTVGQELHEGWTKYTVSGGFNEYKEARDLRENVRMKGVVKPFVTAYNSGKRITVQEALMITSQKWYP
jgi:hypothetical protein